MKGFQRGPAAYAFQSYDAALLIDGALKLTKGNTAAKDAAKAALKKADFTSLVGFKLSTDLPDPASLGQGRQRPDGKFQTEIGTKVFTSYADPHAKDCPMK